MLHDIQIVSRNQISGAGTTQLRCNQPAEYLRSKGYSVTVSNIYEATPCARKLLIINRCIADPYTKLFVFFSRLRGCIIAYDVDDLLFDRDGQNYLLEIPNRGGSAYADEKLYAGAMAMSDLVIVSTGFLLERARPIVNKCVVMKNAASYDYEKKSKDVRDRRKDHDSVIIAYLSGSRTHDADFMVAAAEIRRLMQDFTNVHLLIVGHLTIPEELDIVSERVSQKAFVEYTDYPMLFSDIDINLVPLEEDTPFCMSKSELKYIEAAACKVPTVASPTPAYFSAIRDGENGRLATKGEWYDVLRSLIENPHARSQLATNAFEDYQRKYSPDVRAEDWSSFIETTQRIFATPTRALAGSPAWKSIIDALFLYWQKQRRFKRRLVRFMKASVK